MLHGNRPTADITPESAATRQDIAEFRTFVSVVYVPPRKRGDATRSVLDMSGRYRPLRSRLSRGGDTAPQRLLKRVERSRYAVSTKHSSFARARETRALTPRQLHHRRILPRTVKPAKFLKMAPALDRTGSRVVAFVQRRGFTLPQLTLAGAAEMHTRRTNEPPLTPASLSSLRFLSTSQETE
jgi:hypothetical protein